ncbi:hypothetical protein [uncultured Bifidobacterium sp.]|uniref:hypothetical protein n=1 Tax=uncultured Bifidobacterium sp. TaxID=165187 RepID=UPI002592950B|nr:hypothetical protein [uncultured Bifidobacterium sp.]
MSDMQYAPLASGRSDAPGEGAGGHLYARAIRVHVRGLISRTSQAGRPAMGVTVITGGGL